MTTVAPFDRARRAGRSRTRSQGRTLLEVLVALAIGSVVLGAVLVAVTGSGLTGRKQDAQAQLAEDGQIALNLMATQLRMTGFWVPTSMSLSIDRPADAMLIGCRNGFNNPAAAWAVLASATGCVAGEAVAGRDAIAVRFDATEGGVAVAWDCLGNDVTAMGGWVDDRFYVLPGNLTPTGNPALYCKGAGAANGQMLMDNVEGLSLRYGVAAVTAPDETSNRLFDLPAFGGETVTYMTADELDPACPVSGPVPANSWCAVSSVRICLLMRSADNAVDEVATPYIDCGGQQRAQPDRRLRRALATTVTIRNRTAVPSVSTL
jgi:type IV pilus assembly protein PilW